MRVCGLIKGRAGACCGRRAKLTHVARDPLEPAYGVLWVVVSQVVVEHRDVDGKATRLDRRLFGSGFVRRSGLGVCARFVGLRKAHAGVLGGRRAKLTREGPQNLCAYMRSNSRPSEASAAKLGVRNSPLPGWPAGRWGAKLLQPQSSMTR